MAFWLIGKMTTYFPVLDFNNKRFKIYCTKHWGYGLHHFIDIKSYANTFVIITIMAPHKQ